MTKEWFAVVDTPTGERYVHQVLDETDKNHTEEDVEMTNQGRMYSVEG